MPKSAPKVSDGRAKWRGPVFYREEPRKATAAPLVTCGSTLTKDAKLTSDLYCPSGVGIILGSNVSLDLGGHRLVGPGSSGIGIQSLDDSLGGNTIRNGEVKNWQKSIYLNNLAAGAAPSSISEVVLRSAPVGNDFGKRNAAFD